MKYDLFTSPTDGLQSLLWNLVRIASPTGDTGALADYLHRYLLAQGMDVNRAGDNLWLMPAGFDVKKPTVLLLGALDTDGVNGRWLYDPYEAEIRDGRLYGVGACRKANIVALLEVFSRMAIDQHHFNVVAALVTDTRSLGAHGLPELLPLLPPVSLTWYFTPTDGLAPLREYGELRLLLEHRGEDATSALLDDLYKLRAHTHVVRAEALSGKGQQAEASLSVKLSVGDDAASIEQELRSLVRGSMKTVMHLPATACVEIGLPTIDADTPTSVLAQVSGARLKWGIGQEQKTDESVALDEMERAIELALKTLNAFKGCPKRKS